MDPACETKQFLNFAKALQIIRDGEHRKRPGKNSTVGGGSQGK